MFLEPHFKGQRSGWIEVVCGSMFSGKTEELIRRLKRARIANQKVEIFKPHLDNRYGGHGVVSHDLNFVNSVSVDCAAEILNYADGTDVVGIDEAQFFDSALIDVCQELALRGIRVVVAGLDMDYRGLPFGPVPGLLAVADYITKVHAICQCCGNLATHSYRKVGGDEQILVGEKDIYEARCRACYANG